MAEHLHYISTWTTLLPGDIIATGTPVGAGIRFDPPRFLKAGDRVEVEVAGVGVLGKPPRRNLAAFCLTLPPTKPSHESTEPDAMDLPANPFKRNLLAGHQQIGLWLSLASPYSTEVGAGAGFDWILIDTEHSPNDVDDVLLALQAAAAYPVAPIVRPAWNDKVLIKRHLDVGALTLLIPYVSTPQEAAAAVAAMRYPTRGVRGVAGLTRATRFGRVKDYAKRVEEELCLLVQVETREALENLEAIATTDGVDGVFIGPADLAAALGHLGNPAHPEVQSAIEGAVKRIRACGKGAGILAMDEASARRYIDWGTTFTAVGQDVSILARGLEKLAATYKG